MRTVELKLADLSKMENVKMSWDAPKRINMHIKAENGSELTIERSEDKYYISARHYTGINSSVTLNYDQVMELKFWLAMNVGNKEP